MSRLDDPVNPAKTEFASGYSCDSPECSGVVAARSDKMSPERASERAGVAGGKPCTRRSESGAGGAKAEQAENMGHSVGLPLLLTGPQDVCDPYGAAVLWLPDSTVSSFWLDFF